MVHGCSTVSFNSWNHTTTAIFKLMAGAFVSRSSDDEIVRRVPHSNGRHGHRQALLYRCHAVSVSPATDAAISEIAIKLQRSQCWKRPASCSHVKKVSNVLKYDIHSY